MEGRGGERVRADVLEIPDADHALEIEDDPIHSVSILRQVTEAVDQFVVRSMLRETGSNLGLNDQGVI